MVEEERDVRVSMTVEPFELVLHPVELDGVARNVGVERDEEPTSEAEPVRRIAGETARRALGRNEPNVRGEVVAEASDAFRVRQIGGRADVVVADRQEIRNAPVLRQAVDQRDVADGKLLGDAAILNRVAALQDETN